MLLLLLLLLLLLPLIFLVEVKFLLSSDVFELEVAAAGTGLMLPPLVRALRLIPFPFLGCVPKSVADRELKLIPAPYPLGTVLFLKSDA